ncbi:unnamed protein product [Eruca vesicaria subsp. sativa]|uniref:Uncharacterized protein n=1 Tax=Eruca vesicaria subsp. sativa TaxID=29727 RepID=A0ABC8JZZ2_ERUVS|nr:unnamed protein product [Eruca vesicaria subsp. sativa]
MRCTQVRIIEPLNSRLFLDFKSIHEIPRMHWRDLKYPIDIYNGSGLQHGSLSRCPFRTKDGIKCVVTGNRAYAFRDGLDYMSGGGRRQLSRTFTKMTYTCYFGPSQIWLETEGGFADFRFNPRLPEVEEFRQSLLNSDPYVHIYGVEGLM